MTDKPRLSHDDFAFAKLLMDIVVDAGKHGPLYQRLASAAGEELKEMMAQLGELPKAPREITLPNGAKAIENPDGSIEQRVENPLSKLEPEEPVVTAQNFTEAKPVEGSNGDVHVERRV